MQSAGEIFKRIRELNNEKIQCTNFYTTHCVKCDINDKIMKELLDVLGDEIHALDEIWHTSFGYNSERED